MGWDRLEKGWLMTGGGQGSSAPKRNTPIIKNFKKRCLVQLISRKIAVESQRWWSLYGPVIITHFPIYKKNIKTIPIQDSERGLTAEKKL